MCFVLYVGINCFFDMYLFFLNNLFFINIFVDFRFYGILLEYCVKYFYQKFVLGRSLRKFLLFELIKEY